MAGITGTENFDVRGRELIFTTSFQREWTELLNIMSVNRLIKKANGTNLYINKVSGELESGDVGEGEDIPFSPYKVEQIPMGSIRLKKQAKQVPIEAISEYGYEYAVQMTDDEFKADIQSEIQEDFFDLLKKGSLTGAESSFQMAFAMAIGKVKDKFKKMHKTATGVVVFVNTLDAYKYIGAANITVQTSFGFDYLENFLGADKVFITSEIDENTIIATPTNNLLCYYVDPADGEFAKAGLSYTKAGETGLVGYHTEGRYRNASTENYVLYGIRLWAEYLDGIAVYTVGSSSAQALDTLTVTSKAGKTSGTTKLTVSPQMADILGQYYVEAVSGTNDPTTITYGTDMTTKSGFVLWDGKSDVTANSGKAVQVVETDRNGKAVGVGKVTSAVVKA